METVRRTGRVFENTWNCPYCGTKNRGRDRECVSCGKPRGKETKYDHNHIAVLKGEEAKAHITSPDWFCECCETYNPDTTQQCKSCGAPRGASKDYFQVRKEQEEKERQNVLEKQNHVNNIETGLFASSFRAISIMILGILTCLLFVLGIIWLIKPDEKVGTVTDLTWETSISLEELTVVKDEGWDLPYDARVIHKEWKFKEYKQQIDHYDKVTVPVTKYRTVQDEDRVWYTYEDMGNGFDMEVEHREPQYHQETYTEWEEQETPVYKDVPVYSYWYTYEQDKWNVVDTKTTNGKKGEEYDPVLTAHGDDQRLTSFNRRYRAYVLTDGETNDFSVEKELYDRMEIGHSIKYNVYKMGNVKISEIDGQSVK